MCWRSFLSWWSSDKWWRRMWKWFNMLSWYICHSVIGRSHQHIYIQIKQCCQVLLIDFRLNILKNKVCIAHKKCAPWHRNVLFWCHRAHFCVQSTLYFLEWIFHSNKTFSSEHLIACQTYMMYINLRISKNT